MRLRAWQQAGMGIKPEGACYVQAPGCRNVNQFEAWELRREKIKYPGERAIEVGLLVYEPSERKSDDETNHITVFLL
jgi:hypothetical protein